MKKNFDTSILVIVSYDLSSHCVYFDTWSEASLYALMFSYIPGADISMTYYINVHS